MMQKQFQLKDSTLIAYKYIKFYSDCALFGIVDVKDMMGQEVRLKDLKFNIFYGLRFLK